MSSPTRAADTPATAIASTAPSTPAPDAVGMPRPVKWAVGSLLVALLGGALVLVALRGDALLLDLSSMARGVFCL